MTPPQVELVARLRTLLVDEPSTREVSMFGGRSFMVEGRMVLSAGKSGDLLVRAAPERHDELTSVPGASTAEMGAGRSMGPSWISVSAEAVATAAGLSFWLGVALQHQRATRGH